MVRQEPSLFSYKQGFSLLHRAPAGLKLAAMFASGCIVFFLPLVPCLFFIAVCSAAAFACSFSLSEQLHAIQPAAYYALMLYTVSLVTLFTSGTSLSPSSFMPLPGDVLLTLRMVLAMQLTSLLYRTTTPLDIRSALASVRIFPFITEGLALLFTFLPMIFSEYRKITLAWRARGGRSGIRMIAVLFPVLISVCMKHSYITLLSIRNRCSGT